MWTLETGLAKKGNVLNYKAVKNTLKFKVPAADSKTALFVELLLPAR